jgi:hypothetical protein
MAARPEKLTNAQKAVIDAIVADGKTFRQLARLKAVGSHRLTEWLADPFFRYALARADELAQLRIGALRRKVEVKLLTRLQKSSESEQIAAIVKGLQVVKTESRTVAPADLAQAPADSDEQPESKLGIKPQTASKLLEVLAASGSDEAGQQSTAKGEQ